MSFARTRALSIATALAIVTAATLAILLGTAQTRATAADALQPTRTLFTDDRFTPTSAPAGYAGSTTLPEQMVALRGETEGFQLALQNTAGAELALDARVVGDNGAFGVGGALSPSFLRVGMVDVPKASTGYGAAGTYADPLPPIAPSSNAGLLHIAAGQWGGILFQVRVRTDAPVGTFAGNIELFDPRTQTVYGRQAFSLQVANGGGSALLQPGQPGALVTTFGVEGQQYWLGDCAMRNGPGGACGQAAPAQRTEQVAGLMSFLDEHGFAPLQTSFGVPHANGSYAGCSYTGKNTGTVDFLTQLKTRYYGTARAIEPGATQFPVRWMPYNTEGCATDSTADSFSSVTDPHHTPGLKQDDALDRRAPAFFKTVASQWSSNGLFTSRTYVKNPFDEPGDASANQRATMQNEVPKANIAIHAAVGNKAKVVLAGWPRDERKGKVCGVFKKGHKSQCFLYDHDTYGNRKLWDNKGKDDVDVWMVPVSRLWGRITQPYLKKLKLNRDREYSNRLASIRKAHHSETWTYSFYTGDHNTPQTVIDAPGTDPTLLYWLAAREGVTGVYFSNLLMGWSSNDGTNSDGSPKKGNPYQHAMYFQHPVYGVAAGWGTFIYPPYSTQYGLTSEDQRNSANGRPVSSLRLEGMRDGEDDANLIAMYRAKFGEKNLDAVLGAIESNKFRPQTAKIGQVVAPVYDNTNLAQRMEIVRRQMIAALG